MLIQFSFQNYKTFKDKVTLSLLASNYDKNTREEENVYLHPGTGFRLLKSATIYGANASGKSNLIKAFGFMRDFVIRSSQKTQAGDRIDVDPFRLSTESEHEPSEFEVVFIHQDILYRYGFEVDQQEVLSEWLYYKPKTKEIELFYREEDEFDIHKRDFPRGKTVQKQGLVRKNTLLISVAAQFNDEKAISIVEWFRSVKALPGLDDDYFQGFTMQMAENPKKKARILELLKNADLGIQNFKPQKQDILSLPIEVIEMIKERHPHTAKQESLNVFSDVATFHKKYDAERRAINEVIFSMIHDESSGTRKFFALAGPILEVLDHGYTLFVDELDSALHPNLVNKLISMFNSKIHNPRNAQLIFNTHYPTLMKAGILRRDQIWFTEKNRYGAAKLYSLADFKSDKVRKNEPYEDNYIEGKYGAIPYLNTFDHFIVAEPEYDEKE